MIIHVQIDQDFSCSPYSAGHFPYRQLPKSRGRGDRDKGRGQLAPEGKRKQAGCGTGLHTHMQTAPDVPGEAKPAWSGRQALWRWREGQKWNPGAWVSRVTCTTSSMGAQGLRDSRRVSWFTDGVSESQREEGIYPRPLSKYTHDSELFSGLLTRSPGARTP